MYYHVSTLILSRNFKLEYLCQSKTIAAHDFKFVSFSLNATICTLLGRPSHLTVQTDRLLDVYLILYRITLFIIYELYIDK